MIFSLLVLASLANASETAAEESARLLMERGVYATRLVEIDKRLAELGATVPDALTVPEKPAYKPSFKAIKVDPSFKGSDKVGEILRAREDEFATCWVIEEHATAFITFIGDGGRVEHSTPTMFWPAKMGEGVPESVKVKACYAGVLETIWNFPVQPLPSKKGAEVEDPYFDPGYNIQVIFG